MPRSAKKVTFWDEAQSYGERVPLLPSAADDAGPLAERKDVRDGLLLPYYYSGSAAAGDAVAVLEKLPALLVLTCSVFTVTGCCSVLMGAVRVVYSSTDIGVARTIMDAHYWAYSDFPMKILKLNMCRLLLRSPTRPVEKLPARYTTVLFRASPEITRCGSSTMGHRVCSGRWLMLLEVRSLV